jgi:hypothetical protein
VDLRSMSVSSCLACCLEVVSSAIDIILSHQTIERLNLGSRILSAFQQLSDPNEPVSSAAEIELGRQTNERLNLSS